MSVLEDTELHHLKTPGQEGTVGEEVYRRIGTPMLFH